MHFTRISRLIPLTAYKSRCTRAASVFSLLAFLTTVALAERVVTVKIGETAPATNRFEYAVDRRNASAVSRKPSVATAKFNEDRHRFDVDGHAIGETTITLMVRSDLVPGEVSPGQTPVQQGRSYVETITVIVIDKQLPRLVRPTRSYTVSKDPPGSPTMTSIMGAEFDRIQDNGTKWRNLKIYGGDSSVATAELSNGPPPRRLIIRGLEPGERTQMTIVGERMHESVWQQVICTINIKVRGQKAPPSRSADAIGKRLDDELTPTLKDLDSMPRRAKDKLLKELQKMVDRVEWLIRDESESELEVTPSEIEGRKQRKAQLFALFTELLNARKKVEESLDKDEKSAGEDEAPAESNQPAETPLATPGGPTEDLGEIGWTDATPESLNLADRIGKRFRATCKSRPGGLAATTIGIGPFAGSSNICMAARYAERIDDRGGIVIFEIEAPLPSYKGNHDGSGISYPVKHSVQAYGWPNQIFSESYPAPRCGFKFVD